VVVEPRRRGPEGRAGQGPPRRAEAERGPPVLQHGGHDDNDGGTAEESVGYVSEGNIDMNLMEEGASMFTL